MYLDVPAMQLYNLKYDGAEVQGERYSGLIVDQSS